MPRKLKIEHLFTVKTYPRDVEINFSFSNMEFLLAEDELPFQRESIKLHAFTGDARVGSRHLLETLSRKEMVPQENIFLSLGSSLANFIIWAALLKRGDEVLIEFPAYEPMFKVPAYLGARIRFFKRDPLDFSLTVAAIAASISEKTKMIILTDSHNPSGNQIPGEVLQYLKTLNQERNITIFIDAVYGKFYRDKSLFVDYPEFIVTASLSKFYGLGSMRIGWAFAPAYIIEKARNFSDYLTPEIPFMPLYLAHILLEHPLFAELEQRIRQRIKTNREIISAYFDRTDFLSCYIPKNGLLFFPEVKSAVDIKKFYAQLYKKYHMVVTEGRFFQMPRHFRMTGVCDPETVAKGLQRLEEALKDSRV
ncbi:MAG: pyridoxal phosphate-dependent aminotransferase [Acidobacteria bacterium]|nr:pyridoxal phosphate-dependent aminotransferase [Acidobacteriota bacterium]MBU4307858.1 pyridoxal phosphate-dependent aminotransferase [Acidobacteriota bacterium]MBU4404449.1 pyridoxal phosphate-dependent aminotransferase [Acidobacteriota bacterium]MCG2810996.1 pyridoxal phosphate-dependent aminotransferase [Candidatus Aminicenantes bacterium]